MHLRLLKLIISALVFLHDRLLERSQKLVGYAVPGSCVFLNYHSISTGTRKRFAAQMEMLTRLARPLRDLRRQKLEDGCHYAAVTFDDAFRSFASNALPTLRSLGIPIILFVPSGYLGRKSTWFDYGGENPVGEEVISPEELLDLMRGGGVEVGSHSVSHRNFVQLVNAEVRNELRDSKTLLETILGCNIHSISFPYGSFGERELKLALEEGYTFCFSVAPHMLRSAISEGLIGRISVQPSDWDVEFRLKLLGAYRWLPWASEWKHRLLKVIVGRGTMKNTQTNG